MVSDKALRREERKKAKLEKAQKLVSKITLTEPSKEVSELPQLVCPKVPLTPKDREARLKKVPVYDEKPAIYGSQMTWCTKLSDLEGDWEWGEPRQWSEDEWEDEILRELGALSKLTWSEIAKMETGEGKRKKRRKRHHPQPISSIIPEAQERWKELDLEQFDTSYRFRLGGAKRAWGFQCGAHFYLVWYERNHQIYPV
ncbi:hypothetical protein L2725_04405 [Shewanella corallii]|uniref:Uncharacterized protein n=1 Tax=Shewanella corallii TaxID=560080 RepID=A0ABT0N5D6_9GAMM|nr:hypothetical protein [Shewanella corallii]MCL2913027.1 hypothetical protein [Shewanella corallii]